MSEQRRHDHRQSIWIIGSGEILWCYQCGAWKVNTTAKPNRWTRPAGIGAPNPALKHLTDCDMYGDEG